MRLRALVAVVAFAPSPAPADDCYAVRPSGGSVSFEVRQAGAPFRGAFRRFGGEICLAQGQVERIDVWLEPASVDAGLPEIDAALKEKEFFETARYPRIAFTGRSVEARGERQTARGMLEIKGRRRDVQVAFRLRRDSGEPVVSGSLTLNRLDYGIGTGEWSDTKWLGTEVKVDFNVKLAAVKAPN
ncbi:MAG TPA: YceI family protein [Burkholderiales bacterium]|jgi:polyisoprenoid-binding protein YceI